MSFPGYFGDEFPIEAADELAYDLAVAAYDSHVTANDAVKDTVLANDPWSILEVDLGASHISVFPDDITPDIAVGAEVRTPLLPEELGAELLGHDGTFYVDQLAAMVCSHLFGIDTVRHMGSLSPGMIAIRLDIEQLTTQIATARQSFAKSDYSDKQAILRFPTSPAFDVVLERTSRLPDMFGFNLHTANIVLEYRDILADA